MKPQPKQSDALWYRQKRVEKAMPRRLERGLIGDRQGEASGPRNHCKISKFHLEGDRSALDFGSLDPLPRIAGDPGQFAPQIIRGRIVHVEGSLRTDRFIGPIRLYFPLVDSAGDSPI